MNRNGKQFRQRLGRTGFSKAKRTARRELEIAKNQVMEKAKTIASEWLAVSRLAGESSDWGYTAEMAAKVAAMGAEIVVLCTTQAGQMLLFGLDDPLPWTIKDLSARARGVLERLQIFCWSDLQAKPRDRFTKVQCSQATLREIQKWAKAAGVELFQ
jgi:hypothetical protein